MFFTVVYLLLSSTERLMLSVLAKGFRGEMVGQDTNDKSSMKPLEKVKSGREDVPLQKTGPCGGRMGKRVRK